MAATTLLGSLTIIQIVSITRYIKDTSNKAHTTSNSDKVTLNSRHRKSNLNLDKPDLEFLQSQLDSCHGIIVKREAELKKIKESKSLKAKRIIQLDAQLQETRNLISKSSQSTEAGSQIPTAEETTVTVYYNNKTINYNEDVKIILLVAKTNTIEQEMTSMSSKLDSLQAMLLLKDNKENKVLANALDLETKLKLSRMMKMILLPALKTKAIQNLS